MTAADQSWYPITVKFTGRCIQCGLEIPAGDEAQYYPKLGIKHTECFELPDDNTEIIIDE